MKSRMSKMSIAVALGLAGAIALALPVQAQEQWAPPALELDSATCNIDGEWELAWSLTDTTDTVNNPDDYTYTVVEVITQIGVDSGPWEDAVLEGTLQVGAQLPRTGDGSLTGIQTVPGDTERVKLKAQSDRTVDAEGKAKEGRGLKNALQHGIDLGDCAAPIPPAPEVVPGADFDYGVGIVVDDGVEPEPEEVGVDAEWIVDIQVPEGVEDTSVEYAITAITDTDTDTGTVETGTVGVGHSTFRIAVTGPLEEAENVMLQLVVEDGAPLILEVELSAYDAPPVADLVADAPDPVLPTLPSTGVPVGVLVGTAVALVATGAMAIRRNRARNGRS
jgi:hypothetical protein